MFTKTFGQILPLIVFCTVVGISQNVQAACIWNGNTGAVASPYDHTDVQDCVTDAASCATTGYSGCVTTDGSVVISIPASQINWDDRVSMDMSNGFANVTSLAVRGAGIGATIITDVGADTTFNRGRLFHISSVRGKKVRITGMTIPACSSACASTSGEIYIHGTGDRNIVDTIAFANEKCTGVSLHGPSAEGVVHSCTFTCVNSCTNAIKPFGTEMHPGPVRRLHLDRNTPGTSKTTRLPIIQDTATGLTTPITPPESSSGIIPFTEHAPADMAMTVQARAQVFTHRKYTTTPLTIPAETASAWEPATEECPLPWIGEAARGSCSATPLTQQSTHRQELKITDRMLLKKVWP